MTTADMVSTASTDDWSTSSAASSSRLWMEEEEEPPQTDQDSLTIRALAISTDSDYLAIARHDNTVRIVDTH